MKNANLDCLVELSENRARARAVGKLLTLDQIEKLIDGLNNARIILIKEAEIKAKEEADKKEKTAKILALMQENNVSFGDLESLKSASSSAIKGRTIEPRYRLEKDGEIHEWTGRGRTPVVFLNYFKETGKSKDDLLIK